VHGGAEVQCGVERGGLGSGQPGRVAEQRSDEHRQRRERDVLLGLVALHAHGAEPVGDALGVLQQPRLSDPRIPAQHHGPGLCGARGGEHLLQSRALLDPSDQRHVRPFGGRRHSWS
jgi:hypothetical protein